MTSAVRVGGERLYKKAHRGETVETPVRDVEVLPRRAARRRAATATPTTRSSAAAGTYVRTLVETLGDAYCSDLRRTAVGPFRVEDAGRELPVARGRRAGPGGRRGAAMRMPS